MNSHALDSHRLTGRTGWRKGLFGRLIITVEVKEAKSYYPSPPPPPGRPVEYVTRWRDANLLDLLCLEKSKNEQA